MAKTLPLKIRFAVIGIGHIGSRHAMHITQNADAELVALIDDKEDFKKQDIAAFPEIPRFSSIDEFLMSGLVADVLCVCTPNNLHHPHTLIGLGHGMHVVCEKPMALDTLQAAEMLTMAESMNRHIFCVMQNRYSPPAVWLKELVENRVMGDVYMVQVNCFWNRDERYYKEGGWRGCAGQDGGTLFTQFSHFLDMIYWIFGDITNIKGQFRDFNHSHLTDFEDSGFLQFDFINGGLCTFNYSTAVHQKNLESSITIIAERGSLKVGGQYMNQVEYCNIEGYEMPELAPCYPPNQYGTYTGSAANHHYIFENVISTLRQEAVATTNVHDGLKVVDMIERIYNFKKKTFDKNASTKLLKDSLYSDKVD